MKYDLRVLRFQCYNCNINRGGMGAEAYKRMLREEGKPYMKKLEKDRQILLPSGSYPHFVSLLEYYRSI